MPDPPYGNEGRLLAPMTGGLMAMGYLPAFTSPFPVLALDQDLPLSIATALVTTAIAAVALGSILCSQMAQRVP